MSRKFRDYLRYSSFPQAVQLYKINPDNINLFLDGIYNTILFKDVIRYYMLGQGSGRDMGHILENVVYLELLRRGYEVYIGKYDELEVDFVAKKPENTIYYQVKCIRLAIRVKIKWGEK